jgi:hypothetical protein
MSGFHMLPARLWGGIETIKSKCFLRFSLTIIVNLKHGGTQGIQTSIGIDITTSHAASKPSFPNLDPEFFVRKRARECLL